MKILLLAVLILLLSVVPPSQADDLVPGYWEQTPLPQTGLATFYAPGMMEYVQGYRQARGQLPDCPDCVGTVALLRAGDIGRKIWLQPAGGDRVGPFLVIDCARQEDVAPLVARNWAVDVSFELGQVWGMTGPLDGVTVLEDPADAVPGAVLRVPTPFYVPPDKVVISPPTATPASAPSAPTPWPTRVPTGLEPYVVTPPTAAIPTLPAPLLPLPLTPIVTTQTPEVTAPPASPGGAGTLLLTPVPTPTFAATQVVVEEVAVGRAGGGLLDPATIPTPPAFIWATPTITPRPPARTPRPDLTPILPPGAESFTPTPESQVSPLVRFWQGIFEHMLP